MPRIVEGSEEALRIDTALGCWRQGDLALDESLFVHLADPAAPLTEAADEAVGEGLQALGSEVRGLIVLTQTCDLVRSCAVRPYVEVSPLVEVGHEALNEVRKGRRPSLATFPALAVRGLAADLDRTMTVEKSLVAAWHRTPGCATDGEVRGLADALARKRARFAFPNDFTALVMKLSGHLAGKHGKDSPEGRALRALREIRISASPRWDADSIALLFRFVPEGDGPDADGAAHLDKWLAMVPPTGRFTEVDGLIVSLEDMTAADYVDGDKLDLDRLSLPR